MSKHRGPGSSRHPSLAAARATARAAQPRVTPMVSTAPTADTTAPAALTVGDWALTVRDDGALVAVHQPSGHSRVLAGPPRGKGT